MKTLLLLSLVGLCGIAWRSPEIVNALSRAGSKAEVPAVQTVPVNAPHQPTSLHQYAELARTDPNAYRKLLESMQSPAERSEVDKLMNFLARGKYE